MSKALGDKPRKEEALLNFQNLVTKYSSVMLFAGINQDKINEWMRRPWSYQNIRAATKWFTLYLEPELLALVNLVNKYPPAGWATLKLTKHPDYKALLGYCNRVKDMWYKKPKFPEDKSRTKYGY